MWFYVYGVVGWWLVGFVWILYLARPFRGWLWIDLFGWSVLACLGPILPLSIGCLILKNASFWNKPIFKRKLKR